MAEDLLQGSQGKLTMILESFSWPVESELKERSQALSKPEYGVCRLGYFTSRA